MHACAYFFIRVYDVCVYVFFLAPNDSTSNGCIRSLHGLYSSGGQWALEANETSVIS